MLLTFLITPSKILDMMILLPLIIFLVASCGGEVRNGAHDGPANVAHYEVVPYSNADGGSWLSVYDSPPPTPPPDLVTILIPPTIPWEGVFEGLMDIAPVDDTESGLEWNIVRVQLRTAALQLTANSGDLVITGRRVHPVTVAVSAQVDGRAVELTGAGDQRPTAGVRSGPPQVLTLGLSGDRVYLFLIARLVPVVQ